MEIVGETHHLRKAPYIPYSLNSQHWTVSFCSTWSTHPGNYPIQPLEKEPHLQKCLWSGYVSSQLGTYHTYPRKEPIPCSTSKKKQKKHVHHISYYIICILHVLVSPDTSSTLSHSLALVLWLNVCFFLCLKAHISRISCGKNTAGTTKMFQFPNLLMHLLNMKCTSMTESDTTILRNQFVTYNCQQPNVWKPCVVLSLNM